MLNVIGGAQAIAVLQALRHLILTCGFPHNVFLHCMSSRYLLYISFFLKSLVHGHYGDSNWRPFEIQVRHSPTESTSLFLYFDSLSQSTMNTFLLSTVINNCYSEEYP